MDLDTVSKQLFFITVRIEGKNAAGKAWSGTGFLYNAALTDRQVMPFLVSNQHVLCNDATELTLHFIENKNDKPVLGSDIAVEISNPHEIVLPHPDKNIDIAIIALGPLLTQMQSNGKNVAMKLLDKNQAMTSEQEKSLDAYQDVMFVGYPSGIYDKRNLTPILRRASTATPIQLDYNGMPTFVIDGAVYGGSSGSPVLIVNVGSYMENGNMVVGSDQIILLGVLAAVHLSKEKGKLVPTALNDVVVDIPNGLGLVYKWSKVDELIDMYCKGKNVIR